MCLEPLELIRDYVLDKGNNEVRLTILPVGVCKEWLEPSKIAAWKLSGGNQQGLPSPLVLSLQVAVL